MLKKLITFEDLEGVQRTEVFWFNLNKAELTKMEAEAAGGKGLTDMMTNMVKNNDHAQIVAMFELLISRAYGVRTEGGISFRKTEELTRDFIQSDAYSELFSELVSDPQSASDFIQNVVPQKLRDNLDKGALEKIQKDLASGKLDAFPTVQQIAEVVQDNQPTETPAANSFLLPDRGPGPKIESGPFAGLTQLQVDNMAKNELVIYMTNPERFQQS